VAQQRILAFLDASVLVAASRSPSGGSALVMEMCRGRRFRAALSARVLLEARVNIVEKFGDAELVRFYQQVAALDPEMVPPPPPERLAQCASIVGDKDAHVLAAALECGAGYLLTLDRRHLITPTIQSAGLPVSVVTPGDFLKEVATQGQG
jgi:predicted nucleic acid-binding protein